MAIQFLAQAGELLTNESGFAGGFVSPFTRVLDLLTAFGFFKVIIPFMLFFALIYAIILKTGVLGDPRTNPWTKPVAAIISIATAFLVVAYTPVVEAIQTFVPQAGFLLLVVLLILMVLGMLGIKTEGQWGEGLAPLAVIIGIVVVVIFLVMVGYAAGPGIGWLYSFSQFMMGQIPIEFTEEELSLLIGIVIVIGIPLAVIYFIIKRT